jgi:hypothetical protein
VLVDGHWRLRIDEVLVHGDGLEAEAFVVRDCALWTSLTKTAESTEVSPESETLLATAFCCLSTAKSAIDIAPTTNGMTATTMSSSMSVNPSSPWCREG